MQIKSLDIKVMCDKNGCRNLATHGIYLYENSPAGKLCFCLDCLKQLKKQIDKITKTKKEK